MRIFLSLICCFFVSMSQDRALARYQSVAILGDSAALGAGSHPELIYDSDRLWQIFMGQVRLETEHQVSEHTEGRSPPMLNILQRSSREFQGGGDWVLLHTLDSLLLRFLSVAENGWGYQLGERLGAQQVQIAARYGERMADLPAQIDRILGQSYSFPEALFILFTGSDLCAPHESLTVTADGFKRQLESGLSYLRRNLSADRRLDVYLVSYLNPLSIIHSADVLAKEIVVQGKSMTCGELRRNGFRAPNVGGEPGIPELFSRFIPPNPVMWCPTLAGLTDKDKAQVSALANKVRAFRIAQQQVAKAFAAEQNSFRVTFLPQTGFLDLGQKDIAQDCFHLGPSGQAQIASAIHAGVIGER